MLRTFSLALAFASAGLLTGCESPDAFPYNPDAQPAPANVTPTASQPSPSASPQVQVQAQTQAQQAQARESISNTDLASLQGEWALVSHIKDGKTLTPGQAQTGKLVITGRRFILLGATALDNMSSGSLSLDASQSPRTITLIADPKDADGKARFGIYDFPDSSDFLRICLPEPGVRRPEGFTPAKGVSILVFKKTQSIRK
jgi:uncharacterized protein (TIGR03067 family)